MTEFDIIVVLPGLLVVLFILMVQAYWTESREFYFKALDEYKDKRLAIHYVNNYKRALIIYRGLVAGLLFCFLSVIIPIISPTEYSIIIAKLILVSISLGLVIFLLSLVFGKYYINYFQPDKVREIIKTRKFN